MRRDKTGRNNNDLPREGFPAEFPEEPEGSPAPEGYEEENPQGDYAFEELPPEEFPPEEYAPEEYAPEGTDAELPGEDAYGEEFPAEEASQETLPGWEEAMSSGGKEKKKKKKEKKRRFGLGKKNRDPDFDEQSDLYYGIEVKPLNELRKGFDSTGEIPQEDTFAQLFDDTVPSLDEEVEKNFAWIQQERRRRVAEAVESAGMDVDEVAGEFGIVAPMPVTSFAADPYTRQHGIDEEESEDADDFTRATMESAKGQTMEIKLNVENDTVELQKNVALPAVDDETVSRILESAGAEEPEEIYSGAAPEGEEGYGAAYDESTYLDSAYDSDSAYEPDGTYETDGEYAASPEETPEEAELPSEEPDAVASDAAVAAAVAEGESQVIAAVEKNDRAVPGFTDVPPAENGVRYREKGLPVHLLNIDVVQSAILSEAAEYDRLPEEQKAAPFRRYAAQEEAESGPEEELDDYTSPGDARSVLQDLHKDSQNLTLRLLITGVSTLVLFFASLFCEGQTDAGAAGSYLIVTVIFLLVCILINGKSLWAGLRGLLRSNATSDSAVAAAAAVVLIQTVAGFLSPQDAAARTNLPIYGSVVTGLMFFGMLGKLSMVNRISRNFRFVTAREQKYTVRTYEDYNTSLKLAGDCVAEAPCIAYQRKTGFLKRFLRLSYEADASERSSAEIAPWGVIGALLVGILTLFITKNISGAVTAIAACACICVPAANLLAINVPLGKLCRRVKRAGAMLAGSQGIEAFGSVNAVMTDAHELFPMGTVVLEGVKTFGSPDPEQAIFAASSVIREVGGILGDVFQQVINENELERVGNITLEDENGISGVVGGKLVLIGNRAILMNHGIEPPERDEVIKYTIGGRKVLFIAVDGVLEAMLVLSYRADRRKKIELQRMEQNGISLILRSTDANITRKFISDTFGIAESSVNIVCGRLGSAYLDAVEGEAPRSDALVATKGRVESLMSVISTCVRARSLPGLLVAVQNIGVILGFLLVAFLSCFGAVLQISSLMLLLYQLFWLVVVLLVPKVKR